MPDSAPLLERYGVHRSVDPRGVLPQQARVLNPDGPLRPHEAAIDVDHLNIDSASWRQIRDACDGDAARMREHISGLVTAAGKMHNPVTGSGGMLIGRVVSVGEQRRDLEAGTRIATLVSLTVTPLRLDEILDLDPSSEKVPVRGRAILFASGAYAEVPDDIDDPVVLGVLDVCGAPAWVARVAEPGMKVVVLGAGGKSGILACAQAVREVGSAGRVLGLCWPPGTEDVAAQAGAETVVVDCTEAPAVLDTVADAFDGGLADLVVVCTNVPGCEGAAILACEDDGRVLFFSMATSFSAAALIAEGLGRSCEMTIGNGFVPGHAALALDLVREHAGLKERFGV